MGIAVLAPCSTLVIYSFIFLISVKGPILNQILEVWHSQIKQKKICPSSFLALYLICFQLESKFSLPGLEKQWCLYHTEKSLAGQSRVKERRDAYTDITEHRNLYVFPPEPEKLTRAETRNKNCSSICHSSHSAQRSPHLDLLTFLTVNSTVVQCLMATSIQRLPPSLNPSDKDR